jgi:hypothetical protein
MQTTTSSKLTAPRLHYFQFVDKKLIIVLLLGRAILRAMALGVKADAHQAEDARGTPEYVRYGVVSLVMRRRCNDLETGRGTRQS